MSAGDVRDILQLPALGSGEPGLTERPPLRQRSRPEREKRPDGVNRELFALIGGAPPLTLAAGPKSRMESSKKPAAKWKMIHFQPAGAPEGFVLSHWTKVGENGTLVPMGTDFSMYNKRAPVIEYTDEEYGTHLSDPNWTKEETDYLLSLCRTFELNFFVVADRYDFKEKSRSVEDIKERYYDMSRKLQAARSAATGVPLTQDPFIFDKAREILRKKHVASLQRKTPDNLKEEELLFFELKRREQLEKKWMAERERLLRLFSNHELPSPAVSVQPPAASTATSTKKFKKAEPPGEPASILPKPTNDKKITIKFKEDAQESPFKKSQIPQGVYLRSLKFTPIKASIQTKFKEIADEFGIPTLPVMPTATVCNRFETLRVNIINLLELKKVVDRQEQELKVLKSRKKLMEKAAAATTAVSAATGTQSGAAVSTSVDPAGSVGLALPPPSAVVESPLAESAKKTKKRGAQTPGSTVVKRTRIT
ncbi:hypothetical protein DFJ73DRAFT_828608 [Zopfochytrium polystomum]|nr:hypothetical protein DFJ73DRAFT_828608 [Zopfochytrium polystomum]